MPDDHCLVIVTGSPGSGKSYFARRIQGQFHSFMLLPYDDLKEEFFDKYGFDDLDERKRLNDKSLMAYYRLLDERMEKGENLIIEYPFCKKHERELQNLVSCHGYDALTVFLHGDSRILYDRWIIRNEADTERHPGHLYRRYHKGIRPLREDLIEQMSYKEFVDSCDAKDYRIHVGTFYPVDVSHFDSIDWHDVFSMVSRLGTQR